MRTESGRLHIVHSLRFKLVGLVVSITVVALLVAWFLSNRLIKNFYILDARSNLITTYNSCNDLFTDERGLPRLFSIPAGELYERVDNPSNATIFIIDYKNNEVYSTVVLTEKEARSLQKIIDDSDFQAIRNSDQKYKFLNWDNSFDLVGVLDNGYVIILERPMEQLNNSILFSSRLFLIIAIVIISLETSIVLIFSNTVTKPIIRMSHVARRMSRLDFDVKAPEDNNDEIGELGHSMNEMSTRLEQSVSELKSVNANLSRDIAEKEKMEEMRSEFLSHVSHELKTPLALIQGYAEGLKDAVNDDPESREFYCDVIADEASKMNTLIMKLLNLNELEFGSEKLNIIRYDLSEQIEAILAANQILMEQKSVRLEKKYEKPLFVWADAFMMSEVFTNYLSNAIHYVKEGGVIRISSERIEKKVRILVYDEGNQLSEEALEKVFLKFYKEDAARTREYGGSGIGLSIVEAIQKSHGQDYGVYNAENGVTFYFELDADNGNEMIVSVDGTEEKMI
ncbi:MAG: HAMP domain-containing protein [Eubacterium sp.]|nr:HAMP domain-containing protein [Eubacterium sp.]